MPVRFAILLVCFGCYSLVCSAVLAATGLQLAHTFVAGDSAPGDLFGSAVALDDDLAVIRSRAFFDLGVPNQTHFFRVEENGDWSEVDVVSLGPTGATFGDELALDGEAIVLGASSMTPGGQPYSDIDLDFFSPIDSTPSGRNQWVEQTVTPLFTEPFDRDALRADDELRRNFQLFQRDDRIGLGRSVDADNGIAVAVATRTSGVVSSTNGAVLVYERDAFGGWAESTTLVPEEGREAGFFGRDVSLSGSTVAVSGFNGIFLFERDSAGVWNQTDRLLNSEPDSDERMLSFITLNGDTLLVRRSGSQMLPTDGIIVEESLLVYERNAAGEWDYVTDLGTTGIAPGIMPEYLTLGGAFEIAVEDGVIAATTSGFDGRVFSSGQPSRVNLYRQNDLGEWVLSEVLKEPDPLVDSNGFPLIEAREFGSSLAFDKGRLLVGAQSAQLEFAGGAAYLFTPVPEPSTLVLLVPALLLSGNRRHR